MLLSPMMMRRTSAVFSTPGIKLTTTMIGKLMIQPQLQQSLRMTRPFHSIITRRCTPCRVVIGGGGGMTPLIGGSRIVQSSQRVFTSTTNHPHSILLRRRGGGFNHHIMTRTGLYSRNHPMKLQPFGFYSHLGSISYFSSSSNFGPGKKPSGGNRIASGLGLLGAASVLFGKTKYLLAALKVTKMASLGSMVFTVGTYTMFFGFPYAVGMVGLILVHETGHALVMHQRGIPFSPMVFMPFMGAVIAMKEHPRDAWEDAMVAAGGPLLGSLGAGAVAIGAHMTESQLLFALADFGFMINLFNLLPIGSMDGGRIAGALSKWVGVGGLGLGGILAYQGIVQNPIFYLILLSGGYETFQRFYNPATHLTPNYYKITTAQRATLTAGYLGMIAALIAAMGANQYYRKPPEVLIREREMMEKSWDARY